MAQYNIQYRMSFQDQELLQWRVDFCLKDGPLVNTPIEIEGTGSPVKIEWKNDGESKMTAIIDGECTIEYVYTGLPGIPLPDVFIEIENDDWLIKIYRSDILFWQGFLGQNDNSYAWVPPPFTFSLKVADTSFSESITVDMLDNDGILLYDYITLADAFNRTLFHSVGYDDPVLNVAYSKKPEVIGSGNILSSLYIHNDAFYSFTDGPDFAKDALEKIVKSLGARLIHSQGAYWLQFIEDISNDPAQIIQITPDNLDGTDITSLDTYSWMGNTTGDNVVYADQSQELVINKALKQQVFNYELKAINQLKNFDWRTSPTSPFTNWEGGFDNEYVRSGTGSVDDPYKLKIPPIGTDEQILSDAISVKIGQLVDVSIRIKSNISLPIGSGQLPEDFTISVRIAVILIDLDNPGGEIYSLDTDGSWLNAPPQGSTLDITSKPNDDETANSIQSNPIPAFGSVTNWGLRFAIQTSIISPNPPSGTTWAAYILPVSVGVFSNRYTNIEEKIVLSKRYSEVADDSEMFFADTGDSGYSNTIFYKDGDEYKPLPQKNWTGNKNIDEIAVRQYGDQLARTTRSVMGEFYSNSVDFMHAVMLRDLNNTRTMQVRDSYNIKACRHALLVHEVMEEGSADQTYTVTPKTDNS